MQRTFGEEATAILTGWRWSSDHAAYIRLTAMGDRFRVEAAMPGSLPNNHSSAPIPWWESNVILRLIERLQQASISIHRKDVEVTKPIQGYECWHCDAQGKTIED